MAFERVTLTALIALTACRSPRALPDPDQVEIKDVVDAVSYLRELPAKDSITVHLVTHDVFRRAMAHEMVIDPEARETERAWLTAFSFANADINLEADVDSQASRIVAVYSPIEKRIMVPRAKTFEHASLAHEVAHALADQSYSTIREGLDNDEFAAWKSLVEGDASATGEIYRGRNHIAGPGAVLWWTANWFDGSTSELTAADGPYPYLSTWSPPYRDGVLLRYVHGLRFVAALHRAGGFALVDRAWKNPPTTTEQILHPEKYVAGEGAVPVRAPPTPVQQSSVLESIAGESETRSALSLCLDDKRVADAASGWGGDAYRISRRSDGKLALLWATTWDDEKAAQRFERAITDAKQCWDGLLARDANAKHATLAGGTAVRRRGQHVVVLRGIEDDATFESAFAGIGERPKPVPPLGNVELRPFPEGDPKVPHGEFAGRRYTLGAFGLQVEVPEEYDAMHSDGPPGVSIRGPESSLYLRVLVLSTEHVERFAREYLEWVADGSKPRAAIVDGGTNAVSLPLGAAEERRYIIGGRTMRIYLAKICGGLRTILIAGELSGPMFDAVLQGTTRIGADPPPACR